MRDLKLDTTTHDLAIEAYDFGLVDGIERVQQQIKIRLAFFLGEWFLDTEFGIPWFQELLGQKPVPLDRVDAVLREQIAGVPDVESIESLSLDYTAATRKLTVTFRVKTTFGTIDQTEASP